MSLSTANFHDLYQKYGRDVYRFALYLSGNVARAEDITAEAFLRIWASPAPAHIHTVKHYLFAIVRNLHVENWRTHKHESTAPSETIAIPGTLDRTLDAKAELARVIAALQQLPTLERAAVLLRATHGLDYNEVAQILDITPAAARVKVHRARKQLLLARKGETCS